MATFISHNPQETEAFGRRLGERLEAGAVLALSGDLGTGKTRLVQGVALGLGISGRVQSPTFALVNVHEGGRLPLYHIDVYRLDTVAQIQGAGLEDYLQTDGVTMIEWAERWFGDGAGDGTGDGARLFKTIRLEVVSETVRRIIYEGFGD